MITVKELGALGVAMSAAVACGDYRDLNEASNKMSRIEKIIYPREEKK